MRSKTRVLAVLSAAVVSMAIAASSSAAADSVVIGSVNPATGETTLLTDKLKKQFTDGGAIAYLYLLARPEGAGYALVRAGRAIDGSCHTELIQTAVAGTDVVLVGPLLQFVFTCEGIEDRCRPKDGGFFPVLCMPNTAMTGCACKPAQYAAPSVGPKCEKVPVVAVIDLSDVVFHSTLD
jgi:hypothetical protein